MLKENDLVMLRLEGKYGYTNTWWRVKFCDLDNTFIGRLEKFIAYEYEDYQLGDDVKWVNSEVQDVWKGEQFCYSDNVTICKCEGLCRNK